MGAERRVQPLKGMTKGRCLERAMSRLLNCCWRSVGMTVAKLIENKLIESKLIKNKSIKSKLIERMTSCCLFSSCGGYYVAVIMWRLL